MKKNEQERQYVDLDAVTELLHLAALTPPKVQVEQEQERRPA